MTDTTERLRELALKMEDFINEPRNGGPQPEPMDTRDYRHEAYRVWTPVRAAFLDTIDHLTQALAEANARADQERAAVVAWLRAHGTGELSNNEHVQRAAMAFANAIERGDHLPTDRQALRADITDRYENTLRSLDDGWRPIESAPTDWTQVDLWVVWKGSGHRYTDCRSGLANGKPDWHTTNDECGWTEVHGTPTHWMPLPAPPATSRGI